LRAERTGDDARYLWAYLDEESNLHIDGQDLGPATAPVSPDGEYEWFRTIRAEHVPRVIELLGGGVDTDILDLLEERYTGLGSYALERMLQESNLPQELFIY
jgi:hypothetical protein